MAAASAADRSQPNVLLTGTPGTGKSTLGALVAQRTGLTQVDVSALVKERGFHSGRDEQFGSLVIDEDALLDEMEDMLAEGGCVVDFHGCELFPERWFDLVLVLRTDNTVLYDRLAARGYAQNKISENVQCEIMEVIAQEAAESYDANIVHRVPSDTAEDMESNVARVEAWLAQWRADRA